MQPAEKSNLLYSEAELKLQHARKAKAERIKDLGEPIQISGKPLTIEVRDNVAWIAENTTVIRKLDLETGKTLQLFRGHTGPVTSLVFVDRVPGSGKADLLISGSWDKTIKVWDVQTKQLISSTDAHGDFVKALHVIPSLRLLVSGGSDKVVRFWDLSTIEEGRPLISVGSLTDHIRPVESFDARALSDRSAILYTADTMGMIKVWEISLDDGTPPRWQSILKEQLRHHRTKVEDIIYGNGHLWTASTDETVHVIPHPPQTPNPTVKPIPPIQHPTAVKTILPLMLTELAEPYLLTGSGEVIRVFDVSSPEEPELITEIDGHWHDVTALRLWFRRTEVEGEPAKIRVEPWIVSASLDGTLRKWRLRELLHPPPPEKAQVEIAQPETAAPSVDLIDEDEERELAELMEED